MAERRGIPVALICAIFWMFVSYRVVLGAHNRLGISRHGVVDVGGPNGRECKHRHVCVVVAGDEEQADDVRTRLWTNFNARKTNKRKDKEERRPY